MSAAARIADLMERAGVRRVFCVPGESYLPLLNELGARPSIQVVTNRHESSSSFMAEAYAKAGGGVGVCMASRAPGALNLAIGLHTAMQDATPVVALVGQVPTTVRDRHAFQEVDLARALAPVVKWAGEAGRADRAVEYVARAFSVALSGRAGPTAVVLPEDVLHGEAGSAEPELPALCRPGAAPAAPESVEQALQWLTRAARPVVVAGRGVLDSQATELLVALAEKMALPVFAAWRRMDVFPNEHPCYAGSMGLAASPQVVQPLLEADVLLAVGTQWNEITSLRYRAPRGRFIHVHPDPGLLAETPSWLPAREALPVVADPGRFLQALAQAWERDGSRVGLPPDRRDWVAQCHRRYLAYSQPRAVAGDGFVHPEGVMRQLAALLPPETAIVSDAGNFTSWYLRFYRFRKPHTHFAPISGAMGYGLPAAIGVALADRDTGRW
ncbi:MAG TPA: thiamine pyrophosphate-binding protein, partial [Limnochordales bacterium]